MLRQHKYQSILVLTLCVLSVVLAFLLPDPELQWHISVSDHSPRNYQIEVTSQKLVVSQYLANDFFPYENINVYSPKGECLGESETRWEISASDRLKQKRILGLFDQGIPLALLNLVMLVLAFINVLWRWREKRYDILFVSLGLCLIGVAVMRVLGPRMSVEPDWSLYDFDCAYSVLIKAELISVNQSAITWFVALLLLIILIELIAVVLFIWPLLAKDPKESQKDVVDD